VQVAGSALRMAGATFRRTLDESASLKESINHYHMSVMAHVQQITACNALHDLTSRLSRILLLSADRCADDLQLSQESLAEMLGVRRSSVTTAAAILRGAGAIDYRRAVIKILDREKLRNMVCECYSTIRRTIDMGFNTHPPLTPGREKRPPQKSSAVLRGRRFLRRRFAGDCLSWPNLRSLSPS
jgi:Crp-like helix-turn-helix domain